MLELIIFVGALLLLMAIGLPVVVAIGMTSFIALAVTSATGLSVELMSLRMVQTLNNYTLLAIPLFILAANIMNSGSTTSRIFDFATALVGFTKGGWGTPMWWPVRCSPPCRVLRWQMPPVLAASRSRR